MKRRLLGFTSVFVFRAMLILGVGSVQAQTPGRIPVFDQPGTGFCNFASNGNDCIDSVITQLGTNIGIGTTAPSAKLDVAGGNLNLENSTTTSGNILKGGVLFLSNFGGNTFLGQNAGNLTMTGNNNTATGANALPANTTGCCNTATGNNALLQNTTGGGNTASGDGALYSNSTGNNNTATGRWALIGNTEGANNTATGVSALQNNIGGSANTATGYSALHNSNNDAYNTATGYYALYSNNGGYENTATGSQALQNNTGGFDNTAIGVGALNLNTTGIYNTATGYSALALNTTGTGNTATGWALSSNTTGSDNTAIGFLANVSQGNLTNATAIGSGAIVNASNKIRLGNTAVTVVEGPPYSTVSDKNAKENFKAVDAEEVLQKIRGVSVTSWIYIGQDPKAFRHYGPVAQDFFSAFGDDGFGTVGNQTTITSTDMNGVLMLAIQALALENETFKTQNESVSAENAKLKARIEALEQLVKSAAQRP